MACRGEGEQGMNNIKRFEQVWGDVGDETGPSGCTRQSFNSVNTRRASV